MICIEDKRAILPQFCGLINPKISISRIYRQVDYQRVFLEVHFRAGFNSLLCVLSALDLIWFFLNEQFTKLSVLRNPNKNAMFREY
jgi:hypothetical protein